MRHCADHWLLIKMRAGRVSGCPRSRRAATGTHTLRIYYCWDDRDFGDTSGQ